MGNKLRIILICIAIFIIMACVVTKDNDQKILKKNKIPIIELLHDAPVGRPAIDIYGRSEREKEIRENLRKLQDEEITEDEYKTIEDKLKKKHWEIIDLTNKWWRDEIISKNEYEKLFEEINNKYK